MQSRPASPFDITRVHSKQKPPWISAVTRLLVSWAPCWSYGQIDVRKNTGRGGPYFSVRWFCSTAPGFRNWHLPVHMGILAHPRPCHRLAVPAAPHGPCTQQFALSFTAPRLCARFIYIYAKSTQTVMAQRLRRRTRTRQVAGSNPGECGWSCTKGGVELIISAATTRPGLGLERPPTPQRFRSHRPS